MIYISYELYKDLSINVNIAYSYLEGQRELYNVENNIFTFTIYIFLIIYFIFKYFFKNNHKCVFLT